MFYIQLSLFISNISSKLYVKYIIYVQMNGAGYAEDVYRNGARGLGASGDAANGPADAQAWGQQPGGPSNGSAYADPDGRNGASAEVPVLFSGYERAFSCHWRMEHMAAVSAPDPGLLLLQRLQGLRDGVGTVATASCVHAGSYGSGNGAAGEGTPEEQLEALVAEGKALLREGRALARAGASLGEADALLRDAMAAFEEAAALDAASIKVQVRGLALML
jgi:hypothetical protein